MRSAGVGLALALALALQTTLARAVVGDTQLDLVLVVVVYMALAAGPVAGLWTGTLGGFAQDVLSGGIVGVSGLTKTVIGFAVGRIGFHFIVEQLWYRFAIYFAATVVHALGFLGLYAMLGSTGWRVPVGSVLAQAVGNAIVGVGATLAIQFVPGLVERRRHRRSSVTRRRLTDWGA